MNFILQYIDLIWLPLAYFAAHKNHRRTALLCIMGCALLMRMQVEMVVTMGYPRGVLNILDIQAFNRGLIIYTIFYITYLVFLHMSSESDKSVVLASSIGMFFMVFFASSVLLML